MATPEDEDHNHDGNIQLWEVNPDYHLILPKIDVSITMRDEAFFAEERGGSWYLDLDENGLAIFYEGTEYGQQHLFNANNAPRRVLKALVRSGRLTAFIQDIADALKEESDEYKEVVEIAERMAQAISSHEAEKE